MKEQTEWLAQMEINGNFGITNEVSDDYFDFESKSRLARSTLAESIFTSGKRMSKTNAFRFFPTKEQNQQEAERKAQLIGTLNAKVRDTKKRFQQFGQVVEEEFGLKAIFTNLENDIKTVQELENDATTKRKTEIKRTYLIDWLLKMEELEEDIKARGQELPDEELGEEEEPAEE